MYFFSNTANASFEDTVLATKDALKRNGFEVLTEIDMRKAFKQHLTLDFRPYLILCAYDPTLSRRAVQIDDDIGSVLFSNVVVQQQTVGHVYISAADPTAFISNHVELDWIIRDLRCHLRQAIKEIEVRPANQRHSRKREEVRCQVAHALP